MERLGGAQDLLHRFAEQPYLVSAVELHLHASPSLVTLMDSLSPVFVATVGEREVYVGEHDNWMVKHGLHWCDTPGLRAHNSLIWLPLLEHEYPVTGARSHFYWEEFCTVGELDGKLTSARALRPAQDEAR